MWLQKEKKEKIKQGCALDVGHHYQFIMMNLYVIHVASIIKMLQKY